MSRKLGPDGPAGLRVAIAGLAGTASAALIYRLVDESHYQDRPAYAPAVGWITAAAVYLVWTWALVWRMDEAATAEHARHHERDAGRATAHALVITASLASLAGVGYLLWATSGARSDLLAGVVGVLSVIASWFAVHTVYTLRYAQLYYAGGEPGIDFNGSTPAYVDFAYLAFTVGMCYGVSDTGVTDRQVRKAVLSQAMVSYLLGAVIIAITLNLVGGLTG